MQKTQLSCSPEPGASIFTHTNKQYRLSIHSNQKKSFIGASIYTRAFKRIV